METRVTSWPSRIAIRFFTARYERESSKYQLTAPAEAHPSRRPAKIAINVRVIGIYLKPRQPTVIRPQKVVSIELEPGTGVMAELRG